METVQVAPVQTVVPTQAVVAAPTQPSIFVLNHVPSIPGGSTNFANRTGYPQVSLIDVDRLARQALELQKAASGSQQDYHSRTLTFLENLVEIQKPVAEILARGTAASSVLESAGLEVDRKTRELLEEPNKSLFERTCFKCHNGDKAKGGFRLDEAFDATKALAQVATKKMPPDGLADDKRLTIISELINLSQEE